jgi:hypothetical protein
MAAAHASLHNRGETKRPEKVDRTQQVVPFSPAQLRDRVVEILAIPPEHIGRRLEEAGIELSPCSY